MWQRVRPIFIIFPIIEKATFIIMLHTIVKDRRNMNKKVVNKRMEERKAIQLEQKLIYLKAEVEKYAMMLSSLEQLKLQIEQLNAEHADFKQACHQYEKTISHQAEEITLLITTLEETRKHNEQGQAFLQTKLEATDEQVQTLSNAIAVYEQKHEELRKEKEAFLEFKHALLQDYTSLYSLLTSWIERVTNMEKDFDFLKINSDKTLKKMEELGEELLKQKQEIEDVKEEVRALTKKFYVVEKMLSELDKEQQKDMVVLQKQILHQHVEIETLLEKTTHFANEIEKILQQLADLTRRIEAKRETSSQPDINEMKEMLAHIVQLLVNTKQPLVEEEKKPPVKPAATTPVNSFLKLQEFIDETQQSIVVSPINKKNQPSLPKTTQAKRARIENQPFQNVRQPRYKQPGEDDDQLPSLMLHGQFPLPDYATPFKPYSFTTTLAKSPPIVAKNSENDLFIMLHRKISLVKKPLEERSEQTATLELEVTPSELTDEPSSYATALHPLPSEETKKSWLLSLFKKQK